MPRQCCCCKEIIIKSNWTNIGILICCCCTYVSIWFNPCIIYGQCWFLINNYWVIKKFQEYSWLLTYLIYSLPLTHFLLLTYLGYKGFFTQGLVPEVVKATWARFIKFSLYPVCHKLITNGLLENQGTAATKVTH